MNMTLPWTAREDKMTNGARHRLEDVRETLGQQASELAHDAAGAADTAGSVAQQLLHGAAELGSQLADATRKSVADLGKDARSTADDLSRVRLTTESETKTRFLPGVTLLAGFGSGLALMYFLDPERGRRRRALLRDKLGKWFRMATETATGTAADLRNRAQGTAIETRKSVEERLAETTSDATPAEAPTSDGYSTEFPDVTHSGVGISTPSSPRSPSWDEQQTPTEGERSTIA